jgi:hypothetical protein
MPVNRRLHHYSTLNLKTMRKIIFDICLLKFFFDNKEITHEMAQKLIDDNGNPFSEELSEEGTPIIVWAIKESEKEFLFIDKTGRGIKSKLEVYDLMTLDVESPLDDRDIDISDFTQNSEIGDHWETRTMKIIRID